jgi:hypothetical protein
MVRRAFVVLCFAFMTVFMASCGQTYHLVSITATPSTGYNLEVPGQTGALIVTATYSNTKTSVVTVSSKYEISASSNPAAPLSVNGVPALAVNQSGVVQASATAGVCTWTSSIPTGATTYAYVTSPYIVNISYTDSGVTVTTSVPISVATAANCYDGQAYLHPTTTT